jgi:hypothetical protein
VYEEIQRTNRAAAGETVAPAGEGAKVADLGRTRRPPTNKGG